MGKKGKKGILGEEREEEKRRWMIEFGWEWRKISGESRHEWSSLIGMRIKLLASDVRNGE